MRVKRRAFNVAAVALLTLSVTCFVLQYRRAHVILIRREGPGLTMIDLNRGNLAFSWEPRTPYRPQWAGQINRYGFRYNVTSDGAWYVWGPVWVPGAALGVGAALFAAFAERLRRRSRAGLCLRCGYDMRATPDRCPECGAVPLSSS